MFLELCISCVTNNKVVIVSIFNNTDVKVKVKECPNSWKHFNESGKCYKGFTEDKNISWMFSQSKCRDNGVSYNLNQHLLEILKHWV